MPGREICEIIADPSRDPVPAGVRSGSVIYCGHVAGSDPSTGELPAGIDAQLQNVFRGMQALVECAGGAIDNIGRVSLFLRQLSDLPAVNQHWVGMFPNADDRPTYKFLQTELVPGSQIELDFFAVAGARRTLLAIPGVEHTNPIPLAVKIGPMLFSSRLLPSDIEKGQYGDTPERQAELSFQHARRLVEMAGGGPENICQIRAFVTEPGIRPAIDEQVHSMFPNEQRRPFVEVLHYPSAGPLQAMIEVIASGLPDASGASVPAAVHEVFHEVSRSASGGPAPAGVRIGDVIFLSRVAGRDPATGGFSGGLGAQFRRALESTDSLLRRSGAGMENVARVTVFDGSPGELGVLDNVWEGLYPDHDDRPARKVVKAGLQAGSLVELSVLAIAGSRRRTPAVL